MRRYPVHPIPKISFLIKEADLFLSISFKQIIGSIYYEFSNTADPRNKTAQRRLSKPSQFDWKQLEDGKWLKDQENIHPAIIGMTVDYLTRNGM